MDYCDFIWWAFVVFTVSYGVSITAVNILGLASLCICVSLGRDMLG